MTLHSRIADSLHTMRTLGSNKTALAVAAVCCAGGLATAGFLIANGTVSLENIRQSAANVGKAKIDDTSIRAASEVGHPEDKPQISQADNQAEPQVESQVEPQQTTAPPTFDIVRVEPDGNAVLAGLSAPGSKIEVMSGNQVLARATANSAGEWALVLDEPLSAGGHQIAVRSISDDTEEPLVSVQNVTVAVPEQALESAIVMLDQPGEPSAVWQSPAKIIRPEVTEQREVLPDASSSAKTVPSDSSNESDNSTDAPATATVEPALEPKVPDQEQDAPLVTIEAVETEGEEDLLVAGASLPKASIRLFLDNKLVGETVAGPVGRWHLQITQTVPKGRLVLRAEQVERSGGAVLARREVPFELDPKIVGSVAATFDPGDAIDDDIRGETATGRDNVKISGEMIRLQRVVVGRGDNLWTIARRIYGSGVRYTTLYSANEGQIRDPATVFPDQVLVVPDEDSLAN